jgi:hypothetical protein
MGFIAGIRGRSPSTYDEASSGLNNIDSNLVPNIAALRLLPDALFLNGVQETPETVLQPFSLDKTSTLPDDGITIVNSLSSNGGLLPGRWIRAETAVPQWTKQYTWVVDPVNGNDENIGASPGPGTGPGTAGALRSMAEVARRLFAVDFVGYVIQLMNPTATTDYFDFTPRLTTIGNGLASNLVAVAGMIVLGQLGPQTLPQSVVGVGGIGAITYGTTPSGPSFVPVNPSGGQQATLSVATAGFWTSRVGQHIVMTSGALAGYTAEVLKDMSPAFAGTARISNWWTPLTAAITGGANVTQNSTDFTFGSPQTFAPGQLLQFGSQFGVTYVLASLDATGMNGTLVTPFTGPTGGTSVYTYNAPFASTTGTFAALGQSPANGDTFIVVDGYTEFNGTWRDTPGYDAIFAPTWINVTFQPTATFIVNVSDCRVVNCQFFCSMQGAGGAGTPQAGGSNQDSVLRLMGCVVQPQLPSPGPNLFNVFNNLTQLVAGAAINTTTFVFTHGNMRPVGWVSQGGAQGGGVRAGRVAVGYTANTSPSAGLLQIFPNVFGLGIFDSQAGSATNVLGEGIGIYRHATLAVDAPLYGLGNAVGSIVTDSGVVLVRAGAAPITPVLTGTSELQFAQLPGGPVPATAMPGFEAANGVPLSGAAATIAFAVGSTSGAVNGLAGLTPADVGSTISLTGGLAQNQGTFTILGVFNGGTTVNIVNVNGPGVTDAGPYGWSISNPGKVPALFPLTTWAQWAAAPFSRDVESYTNGSKIINSVNPTAA